MTHQIKKFFLFTLLLSMVNLCFADVVETQLSQDKIALGENFTLTFSLNNSSGSASPNFSPLEQDFHVLSTNYGSAINIINGATTRQKFWQLTLAPKRAGEIVIPEIDFGNAKSASRKLIVMETNDATNTDNQEETTFVQAEISTQTPYVQSQVVYTFKLFYQASFENPRIDIPQIADTTIVQLGDGRNYRTTVNGQLYYVIEKSFAFFPQKAGNLHIPATHFLALGFDRQGMQDPFLMPTPKRISLATEAFDLNVKPIPSEYSNGTWLPAKELVLTEKWSANADAWESGNPVTRTITVEATGLRADQIPDLTFDQIADVKMYVDPPKRSNRIQGDTVIGVLEQKLSYLPDAAITTTLPSVKLNWWDVQTNSLKEATLPSLTVHVKGNPAPAISNPSSMGLAESQALQPADTIKLNVPVAKLKEKPFYFFIWFWVAVLSLMLWLVTLGALWRRRIVNKMPTIKQEPQGLPESKTINEKSFELACKQGNAMGAHQYLLMWGRKEWSGQSLREYIQNDSFTTALTDLELAIYGKKGEAWDGHALWTAYQTVKVQLKKSNGKKKYRKENGFDLLPPLNP